MKTNFSHLKSTTAHAISLVHQNPKIIFASLLMSVMSLIGRMTDQAILSLITSLVLFSWGFVELDLLHQAKQNKKIIWSDLIKKIGHYLKRTWPLIAIGLVILMLIIPLLVSLYLMQNPQGMQTVMASMLNLPLFVLIVDMITTILSLWFVQSMVIFVVDNQPILRSLKLAGQYLIKHIWFLLAITLILSIIGLLARALIEISPLIIATRIAYLLFSAYLGLIIKSVFLTNYLK